ncbi:MAG: hypothetical protein KF823_11440 [Xanthomonadales bacterium]|nr:hypothetical protein [Xanthomonadales bacterium]
MIPSDRRSGPARGALASVLLLLAASTPLVPLAAPAQAIDTRAAAEVFDQAQALCTEDAGVLWARMLCGPLLLVEPGTGAAVGNRPDLSGVLAAKHGTAVFAGRLPDDLPRGERILEWDNVRWAQLAWPLPADPLDRRQLLGRELWQRLRNELRLPDQAAPASHLDDDPAARRLLQREWRALARALAHRDRPERLHRAVQQAWSARQARHARIGLLAAEAERGQELIEGLGEYTGLLLSGREDPHAWLVRALRRPPGTQPLATAFAHRSGPAWALLLDHAGVVWRVHVRPDADLAAQAHQAITAP